METTKIYVLEKNIIGLLGSGYPHSFYLSRKDAEFAKWMLDKGKKKEYSFARTFFIVREVEAGEVFNDSSEYKKFLKEKENDINKKISECEKCVEKDEKKIDDLKSQLALMKK